MSSGISTPAIQWLKYWWSHRYHAYTDTGNTEYRTVGVPFYQRWRAHWHRQSWLFLRQWAGSYLLRNRSSGCRPSSGRSPMATCWRWQHHRYAPTDHTSRAKLHWWSTHTVVLWERNMDRWRQRTTLQTCLQEDVKTLFYTWKHQDSRRKCTSTVHAVPPFYGI